MKISYPQYYKQFSCIAAACPDSCCKEWEVDVDPVAAAYYRGLPGPLGDRLRSVLRDTEDGVCMTIENGRCPMWRQDGLCRIQAELGHDALCETCRTFPRLRHDYGDFVELGLELSCPEAARLILCGNGQDVCMETQPGDVAAEYDTDIMSTLKASRTTLLSFLEDPAYTVPQALAVMLLYAHEVQTEIDGGDVATLAPGTSLAQANRLAKTGSLSLLLDFFKGLEILTPQWKNRLDEPCPGPWIDIFRQLARYFVQRYWLQAVSDYDLVCRAKLAVAACLVVHALGGDPVQTAQAFSKEIENDPDNIEAILDGAYTAPALTDLNLLSLLLNETV